MLARQTHKLAEDWHKAQPVVEKYERTSGGKEGTRRWNAGKDATLE